MQLKLIKPNIYEVTLHSFELATLISSARWAADGARGELTPEAVEQLRQVVKNYDNAVVRIHPNKEKV